MKRPDFNRWSLALVLTSLLAGCGSADSGAPAADEPVVNAEKHCVTYATPFTPGEPLPATDSASEVKCFTTFPDAISFATKGTVRLPATAKPADLKESDLKPVNGAAPNETVIGIEYVDGLDSSSLAVVSPSGGCGNLFINLNGLAIDDKISSSRSFAGCNHSYHFSDYNGKGAQIDCGGGCYYIGNILNDQTSSIFWTQ